MMGVEEAKEPLLACEEEEEEENVKEQESDEREDLLGTTKGSDSGSESVRVGKMLLEAEVSPSHQISFNKHAPDKELMDIGDLDRLLTKASGYTFLIWLLIMAIVYLSAPKENVVYLDGPERNAATFAFMVLAIALIMSTIPYAAGFKGKRFSGIMTASCVVQVVAMSTNALMAWGPTVVYTDPVTHSLAYLTRYCEWTPLAGFMTFLSEAVDLPADRQAWTRWPLTIAIFQFISAGCGLVLPVCPGPISWNIVMIISCVTYAFMFPRVSCRKQTLDKLKCGPTSAEIEHSERLLFAFRLMAACSIVWTILVVMYFINMAIHWFVPEEHPLRIPGLAMIVDTIFDLIAKCIYIKLIVSVHEAVFDESGRARRRLKELRHMLSVLWESSSDVIVISVRGRKGEISTILSPTYAPLLGTKWPGQEPRRALVVELREESHDDSAVRTEVGAVSNRSVKRAYLVDADLPFDLDETEKTLDIEIDARCVTEAERIISATWSCDVSDTLLLRDIIKSDDTIAKCEIKVTKHTPSAVIAMVRDASERYRLAEAEQRAVLETIARQKDAQAVNRFTRHEVKNGLLASIELCESLRASLEKMNKDETTHQSEPTYPNARVEELDTALHEILDTVMAEAMARDVIHEVYQPKLERLDVLATLSNCGYDVGKSERFQIVSRPSNLSFLLLDPQLLKYIHRNAVSNACKYGKQNGQIVTEVCYVPKDEEFILNVINLPGNNHDELVAMGEEAAEAVFRQGKRLHAQLDMEGSAAVVSTGDGAWIMKKCAKTLGGTCAIRFYKNRTVFTFRCPTEHFSDVNESLLPWGEACNFEVPPGTWGVAVDDSRIQRKLLARILAHAGVDEDKRVILGESADEIRNLGASMMDVIRGNPNSRVLILMDENLDIVEEGKQVLVSGSSCLEELLGSLQGDEETRVLALVRSANDSGEDVDVYTSRSHGFFPKAPMKRERVREILGSLWAKRFHQNTCGKACQDMEAARKKTAKALSFAGNLIAEGVTQSRWPRIWRALETLKENLISEKWSPKTKPVVELINNMDAGGVPSEFDKKWEAINDTVVEYVFKGKPRSSAGKLCGR